jgi:hypothetical protein
VTDNEKIDAVHKYIASRLLEIAQMVPDHYLTLVMRHPDRPGADAVLGDDPDNEAAVAALIACVIKHAPTEMH